jgi:hypothetical protein
MNYLKYPAEPENNKIFKQTMELTLNEQMVDVKPIHSNFASINLLSDIDSKFINLMKFINKLKDTDKGISIRVTDLNLFKNFDVSKFNGDLTVSLSLINNSYDDIKSYMEGKAKQNIIDILELRDEPTTSTSYVIYEKTLMAMLQELANIKCSLKSNTYLKEIIQNYNKYNIQSLGFDQYGVCVSSSPKVSDLYNYIIDTDIMRKLTKNKLVITQTSAVCSKIDGITNTFASTLWLLDFLFQTAFGNISKAYATMNNTFDSNIYAIIAFSYATRGSAVFFDYYTKMNGEGSAARGINISNISPNLSIYITRNLKEYFVTLIYKNNISETVKRDFNKPQLNNIKINIRLNYVGKEGYITRLLCNQTELGVKGITIGEYTFDGSQDGNPIHVGPNHSDELLKGPTIQSKDSVFSFIIEESSAVILRVPIVASGGNSFFPTINDTDESNTVVTLLPDAKEMNSSPTTMSLKNFKKNYLS